MNCPPCNQDCNQGRNCPASKPLNNDLIWTYAHLNKITGNVVEFVRTIEKAHGIK